MKWEDLGDASNAKNYTVYYDGNWRVAIWGESYTPPYHRCGPDFDCREDAKRWCEMHYATGA